MKLFVLPLVLFASLALAAPDEDLLLKPKGLVDVYNGIILLATFTTLVPYAFCAMAELLLAVPRRAEAATTALAAGLASQGVQNGGRSRHGTAIDRFADSDWAGGGERRPIRAFSNSQR